MTRRARALLLALIQLVLLFTVVPVASAVGDGQAQAGSGECDRPDSPTAETDVDQPHVRGEGLGAGEATALMYDGGGWTAPEGGPVLAVAAHGSITREADRPKASIDRARLRLGHDLVAPQTATRFADDAAALCRTNSFVPGTAVLMADGTSTPIDEVEIGDYVWATDPETGEAGPRRVTDTIVGDGEKHLVDVQIDGDVITATAQHPFWVDDQGRWINAEDLEAGDRLELPDGTTVAVEAVGTRIAVQRVHNLTIDGIHTYHALVGDDPVLVHNCSIVDRAAELRARAGRNRVSVETPNGRMSIDLQGRSHYERTVGSAVDTPHVKFETRHVGPNGQVSYTSGPVRPATFDDLRLVERILRERGL